MKVVTVIPSRRGRGTTHLQPLIRKIPFDGKWVELSPQEWHQLTGLSPAFFSKDGLLRLGYQLCRRTLPTVGLRLYIRRWPVKNERKAKKQ